MTAYKDMVGPSKILRQGDMGDGRKKMHFRCPGCGDVHGVLIDPVNGWNWNGNAEKPTFTPSLLVTYPANPDASDEFSEWRTERRCHSFVTDGRIQFLSDCTHKLAGQTAEIPPFFEDD